MGFATLDALLAAMPGQHRHLYKASLASQVAGGFASLWKAAGNPTAGANPGSTTPTIPTKDTVGAIPLINPAYGHHNYLAKLHLAGGNAGILILYDRLWHCSGFSANITDEQYMGATVEINRPDGIGLDVEIWLEVYTAIGATVATVTANYFDYWYGNLAATTITTASAAAGRMFPFSLASSSISGGPIRVDSIQLSAATGAVGDIGITLLRRIAEIPIPAANQGQSLDVFALGMPQIFTDACLALMAQTSTTSSGIVSGALEIVSD